MNIVIGFHQMRRPLSRRSRIGICGILSRINGAGKITTSMKATAHAKATHFKNRRALALPVRTRE